MIGVPSPRALALLILGVLATRIAAIYPEGHFNHVTKISDEGQLNTLIDETLSKDKTLMVRWIARKVRVCIVS